MVKVIENYAPVPIDALCNFPPGALVRTVHSKKIILRSADGVRGISGVYLSTGEMVLDYSMSCEALPSGAQIILEQE